jgi:hypothetical protein
MTTTKKTSVAAAQDKTSAPTALAPLPNQTPPANPVPENTAPSKPALKKAAVKKEATPPAATPVIVISKPAAAPLPGKKVAASAKPAQAGEPNGRKTIKTADAPKSQKRAVSAKVKLEKPKKPKLVRDSFTIPKVEYSVLDELKLRANKLAKPAKKSELLRAGIKALAAMSDTAFLAALGQVPAIKTGRPSSAA